MSRYSQFDEVDSQHDTIINQDEIKKEPVCIKSLLSQPNALMDKIQFTTYDAKNYYPGVMSKLPQMLSRHQYYIDRNNMVLMDQATFAHEKMKKDFARAWGTKKTITGQELLTLSEFYTGKNLIYQKYITSHPNNYFATYTLNMSSTHPEKHQLPRTFIIRNTKTPLLTQRSKTQRLTHCKPQIDFNSNFQSGNLYKVYQKEYNQYDLILQNDVNTKGNNQWFFFSVKNVPKGTNVKFNLVNMAKKYSLFDYGMKPAVFSMMKYEKRSIGWVRDGAKVNYRENGELKRQTSQCPYYNLSFQYKFTYDGDIVYFSYSIPYTFGNLCTYLSNTLLDRSYSRKVRVRSLGPTFGGNQVTLFELTNCESRVDKKSIWVLGRQHSGQVSSSFMVEGMINYLLSGCEQAEYLMNKFIFKIVPMLNIDGVVHGNTRAELSGHDPNRKWSDPSKIYQPVIYNIKKMIQKDLVEMVLDLHSHSRKLGTFFYCNSSPLYTNSTKIFPMMVCKNDERFDYKSNRFRGGNNMTARRIIYEMLNIPYIYTIQSSLYGYQKESDFRITPYQPNDYREMGQTVLKTFAEMIVKKRGIKDQRLLLVSSQQLKEEGNMWDMMNEVDDIQSMGSDDDPAGDELTKKELDAIFQRKVKKNINKQKKKKEESKVKLRKKVEELKKEEEVKVKKNDKESTYKKLFSGRTSFISKQNTTSFDFYKRPKADNKNFGCQVQIHQKAVLHRSSLHNVQMSTPRQKSTDRLFQKKSLCVVGQKVQDDLIISGNTVGIQIEMDKTFLRNRNQVQLQNRNIAKRLLSSQNRKVSSVLLHNENNFLNRGDILHKAMKMLNNRG